MKENELSKILDIPMKYHDKYISIIRKIDAKNRTILPPEIKRFYDTSCKITMNIIDGVIVITPIKKER